ncbi:uncharacterized protein BO66DRAFT_41765 [Aspergillus aculeatinus CBS 121060]|uniref:Uncharacterized protein n=1 Tax=Aspergillus aculeatinus CBS 121060 TaxID=1448322 RepID=A0ACD1HDL5_9EURO|nr:hypothetical protein BO66DRAFT_41765 [Aspergillus aculeatinus CBS 121060]RAH71871.1 hypothetical protein BO66DRAFT_41765 [Aspergillus aculeatinus CBS 121060]
MSSSFRGLRLDNSTLNGHSSVVYGHFGARVDDGAKIYRPPLRALDQYPRKELRCKSSQVKQLSHRTVSHAVIQRVVFASDVRTAGDSSYFAVPKFP